MHTNAIKTVEQQGYDHSKAIADVIFYGLGTVQ